MSCTKDIDNIIFNIEKISKTGKIVYIFVGNVDESIKKILLKQKIKKYQDKIELSKLKSNFKNELSNWLNYIKQKYINLYLIILKIMII